MRQFQLNQPDQFHQYHHNAQLIEQIQLFATQQTLDERQIKTHIGWILRFAKYHDEQDLQENRNGKVSTFLNYLATDLNFDINVQHQALTALKFLYQDFYQLSLQQLDFISLENRRGYLQRFGSTHCHGVIARLDKRSQLIAKLMVYANLKIKQVLNLTTSDINFKKNQIRVHQTNHKDFLVNIPMQLILDLRIQVMKINQLAFNDEISTQNIDVIKQTSSAYLFPSSNYLSVKNAQSLFIPLATHVVKSHLKLAIKTYLNHYSKVIRGNSINNIIHSLKTNQVELCQLPPISNNRSDKELIAKANSLFSPQASFSFELSATS